jgi:hypothetical protein
LLYLFKWTEDRERLESALRKLEKNAEAAQQHENELVRQRDENLYLKETIDKLKLDLEEIRGSRGLSTNKKYPFCSIKCFTRIYFIFNMFIILNMSLLNSMLLMMLMT